MYLILKRNVTFRARRYAEGAIVFVGDGIAGEWVRRGLAEKYQGRRLPNGEPDDPRWTDPVGQPARDTKPMKTRGPKRADASDEAVIVAHGASLDGPDAEDGD